MAEHTLCNNCKSKIIYIVSRKGGRTAKCDILPVTAYQKSGRIVEVYLLHECGNDRSSDKTSEKATPKGRLWVGPDNNSGRDGNGSQ